MKKKTGKLGEKIAIEYLKHRNFNILDSNFYIWGGEIDIIAAKDDSIHFVEVKARRSEKWIKIEESITIKKLRLIEKTANYWLEKRNIQNPFWQIDFIGIIISPKNSLKRIEFIEDIGDY